MTAAARVGDMHACPITAHPGGPILTGCATVLVDSLPAARVGDTAACAGPDLIVIGEPSVLIGFQPAARVGDPTAHGGLIAQGSPTVLIGTPGQAQVLADAATRGTPLCEVCSGS